MIKLIYFTEGRILISDCLARTSQLTSSTMSIPSSFLSNAYVKVLVVPVNPIQQSTFSKFLSKLTAISFVSVGELTPDAKVAKFTQQLYHRDSMYFDYVTSYDKEQAQLEEIDLGRQIFVVIGILHCQECVNLKSSMKEFQQIVQRYPSCLASRCFAFEPADSQTDDTKGLIMIPNVGDINFYLQEMMNDLTSDILMAFGSLVTVC